MKKLSVCVLFGGMGPAHEFSLRSAEFVLSCLDPEKYNVFPVGITEKGDWVLYTGSDYSLLPSGEWQNYPENRRAAISPVRGQGLLSFEGDCVVREWIDVVFPVLYGENGEERAVQGLLQMAGIPFVGPGVHASIVAMDKTLTKLVADHAGVDQAAWLQVRSAELDNHLEAVLDRVEAKFQYPMFVKPAGNGAPAGFSKANDRQGLKDGLLKAGSFGKKILVEEFICGQEIEVAVMGNDSPMASICGEVDSKESLHSVDGSVFYIPARIGEEVEEQIRDAAVKIYTAVGCQGLSRVDFLVSQDDGRVYFNEINTMPGFSFGSMYPKLFAASGIDNQQLIDELLQLAMEAVQ